MRSTFIRAGLLAVVFAVLVSSNVGESVQAREITGFQWVTPTKLGEVDLYDGELPVLRYMYNYDDSTPESLHDTYKVFHHVFGPGTKDIITKGAGGKYTHHRGMYVGWNKTQTKEGSFDFWHCKNGAHLKHEKTLKMTADAGSASMTTEIHWNDKNGKPVIIEHRTLTVSKLKGENGYQFDWSTTLNSKRGDIELTGDRQHAGFQFRAAQSIADSNGARYVRPEGFPQGEAAFQVGDQGNPPKHINLGWFAMNYKINGKQYTIEYLEAPGQPKPSLYSERPYGRFGAFYKANITEEKPLHMKYRVNVIADEVTKQEDVQKRYDEFVKELSAS